MSRTILPVHHFTGLRAIGLRADGRPIYPIKGGAKDDDRDDRDNDRDQDDAEDDADDDGDEDDDEDIDWKARAEQAERDAEKWKRSSRKHETRWKRYRDSGKNDRGNARQGGRRDGDDEDDFEAALSNAREEERQKIVNQYGGKLVDAEIRAAARGRMSDAQIEALLDGVDRSRFLGDDGDVDVDEVEDYVERLAPARRRREDDEDDDRRDSGEKGSRKRGTARGGPGMGQGRGSRRDDKSGGGVSAGRSRYQSRRGEKETTSSGRS